MEGKKSKPRAILVFGAPCSGKTTFSEKFAGKFNLAYYDLDEIIKDYGFERKTLIDMFELITKTRQSIVIEGGLSTEAERKELKQAFDKCGYKTCLVWIQTDISTIRNRMKSKYKSVSKAKSIYETEIAGIEAPTAYEHPVILSGKHTFETQTKHVLAGLANVRPR